MSEERVQKLDALDFDWSPRSTPWDERLGELAKYKDEHGHCNVIQSYGTLGKWVLNLRQRKGKLTQERVQKLDDIGFVWNPTPSWDEHLDELSKYKSEHGDCNVPTSQGPLGTWVNTQRRAYKKGKLSEKRVRKLDDISFSWGRGATSNSNRRPTRGSRSRSVAGVAEEGEKDGERNKQRRNVAAANDDNAGKDSAPTKSTSTGDRDEAGVSVGGEAGPGGTAAAGTMPPPTNLDEPVSESEGSDLPPLSAQKSDTSDREHLIPSHEVAAVAVTFLVDADADRGNLKPGSLRPDSVPSSDPNPCDDETVCTTEVKLEEYDNQGADDGDDDVDEKATGRDGALLARIKALEEKNASLEAENERMKLVEAKIAILEAENTSLRREVNLKKDAEG